jgi:hypothetical protein
MKKDDQFLLIGLSAGLLGYISFYFIPEIIIITNIFILIGGGSIGISAIIRTRNHLKWLNSDNESDKTKEDD